MYTVSIAFNKIPSTVVGSDNCDLGIQFSVRDDRDFRYDLESWSGNVSPTGVALAEPQFSLQLDVISRAMADLGYADLDPAADKLVYGDLDYDGVREAQALGVRALEELLDLGEQYAGFKNKKKGRGKKYVDASYTKHEHDVKHGHGRKKRD